MRRYLFLALLTATFSAHALQSLRVDGQVLVVGDSAARVKGLLGEPTVIANARPIDSKTQKKAAGKSSKGNGSNKKNNGKGNKGARGNNKSKEQKTGSETWRYQRDGHVTTFVIVGGKIADIQDAAR
jgi:hypothetical protein